MHLIFSLGAIILLLHKIFGRGHILSSSSKNFSLPAVNGYYNERYCNLTNFLNLHPLSSHCRILNRLLALSPSMPLKTWVIIFFMNQPRSAGELMMLFPVWVQWQKKATVPSGMNSFQFFKWAAANMLSFMKKKRWLKGKNQEPRR